MVNLPECSICNVLVGCAGPGWINACAEQTSWAEVSEGSNGVTATAVQSGEEHQFNFHLVLEEAVVQLYPIQEYVLLLS